MSKSYRGWSEVDDWPAGRALRRPHKRKSELEWKMELRKEEAVSEEVRVFVIINEWTDIANDTSSEIVGGNWFESEDEAWAALNVIAEAHDVELDYDNTSINLESQGGLQSEEYRIEELSRVN